MKNIIVDALILGGTAALSVGTGFLYTWPVGLMVGGGITLVLGVATALARGGK